MGKLATIKNMATIAMLIFLLVILVPVVNTLYPLFMPIPNESNIDKVKVGTNNNPAQITGALENTELIDTREFNLAITLSEDQSTTGLHLGDNQATSNYIALDYEESYDIQEALAEIETIYLDPANISIENNYRLSELHNQLSVLASIDKDIRERLTQTFHDHSGNALGTFVLEILAQYNDPEIVELGLELVQSNDIDQLKSGLMLLSQKNSNDSRVSESVELLLEQKITDPAILTMLLDLNMHSAIDESKTDYQLTVLSELMQHNDAEVRSASIFNYSRHARNEQELEAIFKELQSDSDNDRISAASALSISTINSERIRDELLAKLYDTEELQDVRQAAADGLARFDLTDAQRAAVAEFRDSISNL